MPLLIPNHLTISDHQRIQFSDCHSNLEQTYFELTVVDSSMELRHLDLDHSFQLASTQVQLMTHLPSNRLQLDLYQLLR